MYTINGKNACIIQCVHQISSNVGRIHYVQSKYYIYEPCAIEIPFKRCCCLVDMVQEKSFFESSELTKSILCHTFGAFFGKNMRNADFKFAKKMSMRIESQKSEWRINPPNWRINIIYTNHIKSHNVNVIYVVRQPAYTMSAIDMQMYHHVHSFP